MLKIRLRRMGARNAPFYRIVVSDSRRVPTAVALEEIGWYDPRKQPAGFVVDRARFDHWVGVGAQLSPSVASLVRNMPAPGAVPVVKAAPVPVAAPAPAPVVEEPVPAAVLEAPAPEAPSAEAV